MYSRTLHRLSTCWAVLLAAPVAAMAAPITFGFTGVVTSVNTPLAVEFSVGESVVGNYTFESTTADADPGDVTRGHYDNAITAFTATFGGDYVVAMGLDNTILVYDGPTGNDVYIVDLVDPTADPVAGYNISAFTLTLIDNDSTVFTSAAIPLTPPDLSEFENDYSWSIFFNGDNEWIDIKLTSLALIPEPGSITLLLCGLTGLFCLRHRK